MPFEDLEELIAYIPHSRHVSRLHEILQTERFGISSSFPGIIQIEVGEMITGLIVEFGFLLIGSFLLVLWSVPD